MPSPTRRRTLAILLTGTLSAALAAAPAVAQEADRPSTAVAEANAEALESWAADVWRSARSGRAGATLDLLESVPAGAFDAEAGKLAASAERLQANIEEREKMRAERIEEVRTELREAAAEDDLLDGLRAAIEIETLSADTQDIKSDQEVQRLIGLAVDRAGEAEADGDWLEAHALYARLHLLYEQEGTYKDDLRRLAQRRMMLRLYVPERLHDLVNERRIADEEEPLPPFNAVGEDWREKLAGIDDIMVMRAINTAATNHVDRVEIEDILISGLLGVKTLVTTSDLSTEFPGLDRDNARERMIEFLDDRVATLAQGGGRDTFRVLIGTVKDLLDTNDRSVRLPQEAVLHEFADGAMSRLDDFTSIIWPGDLEQFQRTTQGTFKGVGIQIQLNEASEIVVVTPLSGTPAARAGIRAGDLIRKVNDDSTLGMGLLQAVDRITGEEGTKVRLGIEREGEEDMIEYELVRAEIPIHSIKGWERTGADELDWNWFVDESHGIGYIRLTQFTNNTTEEFKGALKDMRREGLNGLILDMRGNPGGLLSEAVGIVGQFVDRGVVVTQEDHRGMTVGRETVRPGRSAVPDIPVVVLVNGGSASASEIVAGALQDYGEAVIVGDRSFGKGSVQHVLQLAENAAFKLTTQYYRLPGADGAKGRLIHRRPGAKEWGIEPDVSVEMLPEQFAEAYRLRQAADVVEFDRDGNLIPPEEPVDLESLVEDGLDPQLETALILIQSQVIPAANPARAELD